MDLFKRLSDYDVFAYLPQGFMALAAIDYLFGTKLILDSGWDVPKGVLMIFAAYIVGHLIANPSAKIIERWLVREVMKQPATHLLSNNKKSWFSRLFFTDYYAPLSVSLQQEVLKKLGAINPNEVNGEALFWKAYPLAKRDEHAKERMATFINLYGFCRNISFVSALTALALFAQICWVKWNLDTPLETERLWVAIALTIAAFMMFQRYLKFHRLYSVEVFTTFAKVAPTPPVQSDKTPE